MCARARSAHVRGKRVTARAFENQTCEARHMKPGEGVTVSGPKNIRASCYQILCGQLAHPIDRSSDL